MRRSGEARLSLAPDDPAVSQPYERFRAWQACHQLVLLVYGVSSAWPPDERFALTSQARRAAVSAAACLVEGSAKRGKAEFARYADISAGSLAELGYLLRLAGELAYHTADGAAELECRRNDAARLVGGLSRALRGRKRT